MKYIKKITNGHPLAVFTVALIFFIGCSNGYAVDTTARDVASQLQDTFRTLSSMSSDASIIIGVFLFVGGIYHLKRYGEMRTMMSTQMTFSKPMAPLICGILLIAFPSALGTIMRAVWGTGWSSPLAYTVTGDYDVMVPALLSMVRLIGVISFIRAFVSLSNSVGAHTQPGGKTKVIVLILAGLLCVNVTGTLHLINNFFNFSDF